MSYTIILPFDQHEAESFAAWLIKQGHTVTIGRDTGTYVDGIRTSTNETTNETMRQLWERYSNA
jgi:hypothetical protein